MSLSVLFLVCAGAHSSGNEIRECFKDTVSPSVLFLVCAGVLSSGNQIREHRTVALPGRQLNGWIS